MSLLGIGLNTDGGVSGFLKNPLTQDAPSVPREADFKEGFVIEELDINNVGVPKKTIRLVGNMMPKVPFQFGGTQHSKKEYYSGNPEAAIQILGARESDVTIHGRLYAKKFPKPSDDIDVPGAGPSGVPGAGFLKKASTPDLYMLPNAIAEEIDAIRMRGSICQIKLGEWSRYVNIATTDWKMRTLGDIEYEITFTVISINLPSRCPVIKESSLFPVDAKSDLTDLATKLSEDAANRRVPDSVPTSFTGLISEATEAIASAVSGVLGFLDSIIQTGENITTTINRAVGIVRNAEAEVSRARIRLGKISYNLSFDGIPVPEKYSANSIISSRISVSNDFSAQLKKIREALKKQSTSTPLARYLVKNGDTLQNIATHFYKNPELWSKIYDHNKLQTSVLTRGTILEIPKQ